jgi:hypothetical protein
MSVSRTQQLLALVVGLVAFAGESGASSTYASPAEAGGQWLVANENLGARWGRAETLGPLCTAEAIEAFRVPNLRLPTSYYWGASNTLAPKVIAVSPTCQKAFAAKVTLRAGRSHSSTWLSALAAACSPDRSWSGQLYANGIGGQHAGRGDGHRHRPFHAARAVAGSRPAGRRESGAGHIASTQRRRNQSLGPCATRAGIAFKREGCMRTKALLLAGLLLLPAPSQAVYNANLAGVVVDVVVYSDSDQVLFKLNSQPTTHPLCNPAYFAVGTDVDPTRRKVLLARLLLAKATGEPTNIGYDKDGACARPSWSSRQGRRMGSGSCRPCGSCR